MTTASQDNGTTEVRVTTGFPAGPSTLVKMSCVAAFVWMLALAPAPALAQHGGGGAGGGGGSHGGGGGGGGHASGGSGGGGSHAGAAGAPSGGSGSHASGASASGSGNSGAHWWNPFHSGASGSAGVAGNGGTASGSSASSQRFAGGNNTWQDPPAPAARTSGGVNHYAPASGVRPVVVGKQPANGTSFSTRGAVAGPPHVFPPRRGGYPNYFYYPYPYYGFGWGGGLGWGGFYPCDLFWGCYGYGYGYGGGYGFYGGSFGGDYSADLSYDSPDDAAGSQEPNPSLFAAPPSDAGQSVGEASQQQPYVILYLKDGSSYAVSDYWLAGGKLHYVTSYGGENVIDEAQLDLQRTVNDNATRGVDFTLRPEPAGNGDAAPDTQAAPNTQPPAPQQ